MKKSYQFLTVASLSTLLATGVPLPKKATAGPLIEFGEAGYLQLDVKFQGIAEMTDFGSGKDGQEDRWDLYLRRARIVFTGMLNETWGAKFQTCCGTSATHNFGAGGYALSQANDKNNSRVRLTDGYLIGLLDDTFNIKVGLTKIPLTRANLDACFAPLTHERSPFVYTPFGTDATKNSRDVGLMATGNFADNHFKYWAAIMEGREGSAKFYNPFNDMTFTTTAEPKSNFEYVLRFHYSFLDPENRPTAMGYKGTYLGGKGKVLTIGAAGAYEADAAYKDTSPAGAMGTPDFLKGTVNSDETVDYTAWTVDAFFEYPFENGGVLTATGLYLDIDLEDAYKTATAIADQNTIVGGLVGQREGWYAKAGYILPYRPSGKGLLQPFARYESWDMASIFNVQDQTIDQYGLGMNYFPLGSDKLRFSFEYYKTEFDKPTKLGDYLSMTNANTTMYDEYDTITFMFMVQI